MFSPGTGYGKMLFPDIGTGENVFTRYWLRENVISRDWYGKKCFLPLQVTGICYFPRLVREKMFSPSSGYGKYFPRLVREKMFSPGTGYGKMLFPEIGTGENVFSHYWLREYVISRDWYGRKCFHPVLVTGKYISRDCSGKIFCPDIVCLKKIFPDIGTGQNFPRTGYGKMFFPEIIAAEI